MKLPADQADLLRCFVEVGVEFLIVGAHALAVHGVPRYTGDLDVWVRPSAENATRVFSALRNFGAPLSEIRPADFENPDLVFQIGLPPLRIDVLTFLTGIDFETAFAGSVETTVSDIRVRVIGREEFIINKLATGRLRDLADVEHLDARRARRALRNGARPRED